MTLNRLSQSRSSGAFGEQAHSSQLPSSPWFSSSATSVAISDPASFARGDSLHYLAEVTLFPDHLVAPLHWARVGLAQGQSDCRRTRRYRGYSADPANIGDHLSVVIRRNFSDEDEPRCTPNFGQWGAS